MKLVTGGVGVSHVSNSPDGLRLYINDAFAKAHGGDGSSTPLLGLRKATRCPDGWELHLSPQAKLRSKPGRPSGGGLDWVFMRRWNSIAKMPPGLPIGGKTPIVELRTTDDGGYIVVIPAHLTPSSKIGAIKRAKERREAEALGAKPSPEAVTTSLPTCGVADLQRAIKVVNACMESMGDDLIVTLDGKRLRAMIELG